MTAYGMFGVGLIIFLGAGVAVGWPVFRATQERTAAYVAGIAVGILAVIVAFWFYYTRALCPPGAGCA